MSRIWSAVLVQTKVLGSSFHSLIHRRTSASRSVMLRWAEFAVGEFGEPALHQVQPGAAPEFRVAGLRPSARQEHQNQLPWSEVGSRLRRHG